MSDDARKSAINWLLEQTDIGVRYLTMRDLINTNTKELETERLEAHRKGPIATVLEKMKEEGYWEQLGAGYYPKYTGTIWSIILLAQLGASFEIDERIATACSYVLEHALTKNGQFSIDGSPSATVDCLQGNLCRSLLDLGCKDTRLDSAFEWMARSITGEGIAPMSEKTAAVRYYAGKCGPNFACGANNKLSCAWGAIKVMLALGKLPLHKRTRQIEVAIDAGVKFLLSKDPAQADYPCGYSAKPSGNWWKFGFPVFYVTDLLQNIEALVALGYSHDPRLANALELIREKQDKQGRWILEYDYTGKTWANFGLKKQPNKWVTLRALRVLKAAE
jgi:hypothetical protein